MEPRKQAILTALDTFVRQRPGMEPGNYSDAASYRSESRSITKDLHDYRALERAVMLHESITADMLLDASRSAFSGRLTISKMCDHLSDSSSKATCGACGRSWCDDCYPAPSAMCHHCNHYVGSVPAYGSTSIDYCTGQYFPTEYRKAACAVLASALWAWTREHAMPKHSGARLRGNYPGSEAVHDNIDGKTPGDWLRAHFRKLFGARMAAR